MVRSDSISGNFAYLRDSKYWDNSLFRLIKYIVNMSREYANLENAL